MRLDHVYNNIGKELLKHNYYLFQLKGGNSMFDYTLDEAFSSALNIAENEEMNLKINQLDNKINNMNNMLSEEKTEVFDAVVPEWIDKVLDLEFLSPDDKEDYDKYNSLNNSLTADLNAIYLEMERLNNDRLNALKDFDISAVVDIDVRLKELTDNYKTKFAEGEDVRKQLLSKKNEWEITLQQLSDELKDEVWDTKKPFDTSKYPISVVEEYKKNKSFELVKEFVGAFPKDKRNEVLNNPRIKEILKNDFNKLVAELM